MIDFGFQIIIIFYFYFFSVRRLSVLRGHSFFSSPPKRPMTSDFEGFSIPDFIHYIYFSILINIFHFECSVLNKGTTGTIFERLWYDAVLDWGLNPGPPALEASTIPLGYRGSGFQMNPSKVFFTKSKHTYSELHYISISL